MKILLEQKDYKIVEDINQYGLIEVKLFTPDRTLITFMIDSHDNRLTATHIGLVLINPQIQKRMVDDLCEVFEKKYGGKELIVLKNRDALEYISLFADNGFKADLTKEAGGRVRLTSPQKIIEHVKKCDLNNQISNIENSGDFLFVHDKNLAKRHEELTKLAAKSGFSPEKVKDYTEKGVTGYEVMAINSDFVAVIDRQGKIAGSCRISNLGNGIGYICDTWIDETFFGTKEKDLGTAYLYKKAAEEFLHTKYTHLLLISPPGEIRPGKTRVDEFDTNFGCKLPDPSNNPPVVMVRFAPAQAELKNAFAQQAEFVQARNKQKVALQLAEKITATQLAGSIPFISNADKPESRSAAAIQAVAVNPSQSEEAKVSLQK